MLDQGSNTQGTRGCSRILGCVQIPDLNFSVVCPRHDPLVIETDAADELFMSFENSKAGSALDIPQPDCVVRRSADDEIVVVLQTGDAALVPVERSHELAGRRVPDFNSAIAGS